MQRKITYRSKLPYLDIHSPNSMFGRTYSFVFFEIRKKSIDLFSLAIICWSSLSFFLMCPFSCWSLSSRNGWFYSVFYTGSSCSAASCTTFFFYFGGSIHPMVTRSRDGTRRPRAFSSMQSIPHPLPSPYSALLASASPHEPTSFKEASEDSRWLSAMKDGVCCSSAK